MFRMNPYLMGRLADERQGETRRLAGFGRETSHGSFGRPAVAGTMAHDHTRPARAVRSRAAARSHSPRPAERIGGLLIRLGARLGGTVPSGLPSAGRAASAR